MKRHFLYALAALMTVACTQIEPEAPQQDETQTENQEKIFVTIDDEPTRVQLNSKVHTVWNKGDEIMTFHPGVNVYWWKFNGNTGDRSGELTPHRMAQFGSDQGFDTNYAIYPSDKYAGNGHVNGIPAVVLNFPDTQHYTPGSYEKGSNVLVASSDDPYNFKFKTVCSFLRLHLTGTKKVSQISLRANDNEALAGTFFFIISDIVQHHWYETVSAEMKLVCDNVQLSETPTEFYFSLLPLTFKNGFTMTVTFSDGTRMEKITSKSVQMERNTVLPMAVIDTDNSNWQTIEIEHSATTFEAPVFFGSPTPAGYIYWGDGNQTSLYNATGTYVYWDDQPSHTVMIKTEGQNSVEFPSLKGVSEINFSNF